MKHIPRKSSSIALESSWLITTGANIPGVAPDILFRFE